MKNNLKVSIIIPVYNGDPYLEDALNSALGQTYKNIEVIVVNDGSCDDGATRKIVEKYQDQIIYFEKDNGGVASALNYGISKMTGDYFSWLSHDDIYFPNKIENQMAFLEKLKDKKVILYSDFVIYKQATRATKYQKVMFKKESVRGVDLLCYPQVHGCTTLIPKECFEKVGKFDEDLLHYQDYDFWLRSLNSYRFVHVPEFLVVSRHHDSQNSVTGKSARINEMRAFYKTYYKMFMGSNQRIHYYFPELFINAYRLGDSELYSELYKIFKEQLETKSLPGKLKAYALTAFFFKVRLITLMTKFVQYKLKNNSLWVKVRANKSVTKFLKKDKFIGCYL